MKTNELYWSTTSKRYTLSRIFIWQYYHPDEWPESNPKKESNWMEKSKGPTMTNIKMEDKRERSDTFLGETSLLIIQEHTYKECRTRFGTVLMPYPWIGNSHSHSYSYSYSYSSWERKESCSGIIIIFMVPIGQYIIHRTRHTILILTWHEWLLHCHQCTNSSIPTWYHHIEQSTESPNWSYMLGIIV